MLTVLAAGPLIVALAALGLFGRSGLQTGLLTLGTAVVVAALVPAFGLGPLAMARAGAEGVLTSLVVLEVLWPGLLLYHVQRRAGSLDALAGLIARLAGPAHLRLLVLMLGVSPFVESVSGFGLGAVVVTPILVALGIAPARAAALGALSLLAVPWGALAVGTVLGAELTGLDSGLLAARSAVLAAPLPVMYALAALAIEDGWRGVRRGWPAALLGGGTLAGGLWWFSLAVGAELAGVLASLVALGVLLGAARLGARFQGPGFRLQIGWDAPGGGGSLNDALARPTAGGALEIPADRQPETWNLKLETGDVARAVVPYALLTALLLVSRLSEPVRAWLQTHAVLAVPGLDPRLALLYNPGFPVLLAALGAALLSGAGRAGLQEGVRQSWRQFVPGAVAIACFLAAAQVMRAAGMTEALGTAAASLGAGYAWAGPWLGALGGWLTGSNAGSNAMFARLHLEAANRAGLPADWVLGGQNAAASHATMVSPARTILAATAAGVPGREAVLLRQLGPVVIGAVLAIAVLLVLVVQPG